LPRSRRGSPRRKTSRTRRMATLPAGINPLLSQSQRSEPYAQPAEAPVIPYPPGGIIPERWARIDRNAERQLIGIGGRHHSGIGGRLAPESAARWKDYRAKGRERAKVMTLAIDEFIRRFLTHVLPGGFHRIRHYGLFALGHARVLVDEPDAVDHHHVAVGKEFLEYGPACLGKLAKAEALHNAVDRARQSSLLRELCRVPRCARQEKRPSRVDPQDSAREPHRGTCPRPQRKRHLLVVDHRPSANRYAGLCRYSERG
jgi:hypothetical protein